MAKNKIQDPTQGLFGTRPVNTNISGQEKEAPQKTPIQIEPPPKSSETSVSEVQHNLVVSPDKKEARSKKRQILLQPSLDAQAVQKCKRLNISLNEAINQLLKTWVDMLD